MREPRFRLTGWAAALPPLLLGAVFLLYATAHPACGAALGIAVGLVLLLELNRRIREREERDARRLRQELARAERSGGGRTSGGFPPEDGDAEETWLVPEAPWGRETPDFFCTVLFLYAWRRLTELAADRAAASGGQAPEMWVLAAVALGLALGSYPAVEGLLSCFTVLHTRREEPAETKSMRPMTPIALCVVCGIAAVTFCSKSSPLYPLNDWVDSNCFFTVGKGMFQGLVPYRDLLEQKGPLLYFLHGVGWLFSHETFHGVWVLECIAAAAFLWFAHLTARLYCGQTAVLLIPVLSVIVYTSGAFSHGDSAEEFCLPLLTCGLWLGLRHMEEHNAPSVGHALLIGATAGCVFWIKFNLTGFYLGWFLAPALSLVQKRKWGDLCRMTLWILAGAALSTLPWLLYFQSKNAVGDWLTVYLYDNIFLYTDDPARSGLIWKLTMLLDGAASVQRALPALPALAVLGYLWLAASGNRLGPVYFAAMLGVEFLGVYAGRFTLAYYALAFAPFLIPGVICVYRAVIRAVSQTGAALEGVASGFVGLFPALAVGFPALVMVLCPLLTPNRYLMGVPKEDLPQYQFDAYIRETENPTLLNYGFLDGGFYTVSGILPDCKSFCRLNVRIPEYEDLQERWARAGLSDFIVTRNYAPDFTLYEIAAESEFYFEGDQHYYLYRRVSPAGRRAVSLPEYIEEETE